MQSSFVSGWGRALTDTYGNIQKAFDNDSLSRVQVFQWHRDFVNGRETVEGGPRSGRPASVRTGTNIDSVVLSFVKIDV
jgi:hypothetical protein